ncbi:MAG: 4-alpha-glucanotransferase [Prevotellaceae bacterium]|jgi:4-alpha-glucanotransferase|nr:4-alpha-glucanotransferase [Prevotellaceae bacterium]
MQLKFHIHYITKSDENLFVNINGKEFAMRCAHSGWWIIEISETGKSEIKYFYSIKNSDGEEIVAEWRKNHKIKLNKSTEIYDIYDVWFGLDDSQPFYSAAFTDIINKRNIKKINQKIYANAVEFRVNAPQISNKFSLAIAGNNDVLGNWKNPLKMHDDEFPLWKITLDTTKLQLPFEFKFLLINNKTNEIIEWEEGDNRQFYANSFSNSEQKIFTFETSLGSRNAWRGSGTAIPVFALRTENSCGIGDFSDLKLFIDWLKKTNQTLLQILPINDSCAFFDYRDSSPYSAISMYALHPIYINLQAMGKLPAEKQAEYEKISAQLNKSKVVDYEKVIKTKWKFFKEIFNYCGNDCLKSAAYKDFFNKNSFWLKPYAMFCTLRDKFKSPEFNSWKSYEKFEKTDLKKFEKDYEKSLQFYCFLQYHADKQMSEVSKYARQNGIILKGDITIGVGRNSVETWTEPQNFNLENQAGAPPDAFSVNGQNWEFPTYNWDAMQKNGYSWWTNRLKKMAEYFDAYRIDHVLGFFRIWEIPFHSLQGLLGHFNPALPYSLHELQQQGLAMDAQRYLNPYIRCNFINEIFGKNSDYIIKTFFDEIDSDILQFNSDFDTQHKIDTFFKDKNDEQTQLLKSQLFTLINNVLFVEDAVKKNHFHPRIAAHLSTTYKQLDADKKQAFDRIYNEFYYRRNNELWRKKAMEKLPPLICATNMLACCEDLGMIPECVPDVINALQLLSLEVQRMPKKINTDFANSETYPYFSVCTTSTHDTSTLRSWWKENAANTQKYYNQILHQHGDAPEICTGEIVEKILKKHLKSPSMFAVFPFQDWLGIDEKLRRKNEDDERINVPSKPANSWRYRMHITIEKLLKEDEFNAKIKQLIELRIEN